MWFKHFRKLRLPVPYDGPCKQHPAGFSANHAGSDHVISHSEIVFGRKMFFYHLTHPKIPCHHNVTHSGTLFRYVFTTFGKDPGPAEKPVPGIGILFFRRPLLLSQRLVKPAGLYPVKNRSKTPGFRLIDMRKKHRIRIPVPYLFRADIDILRSGIDIKEQLGCIKDLIHSLHRMLPSDNREKGYCVQDEQERACDPEKVPHHKICRPGSLKFREAVKNIERVFSFLFNSVMDVYGKGFESVGQRYIYRLYLRAVLNQRIMACKPEIDDISMILHSLPDIRLHKQPELRKV